MSEEPLIVKQYREYIDNTPNIPRCCHTCANLTTFGECAIADYQKPPKEFKDSLNTCQNWLMEIPF